MRRNRRLFVIWVVFLLIFLTIASEGVCNYHMLTTIQRVFKTYNMTISADQISVTNIPEGGKALTISTKSQRNSFEMVMLIGFISAGYAMKNSSEPIQTVTVVVTVPYKEEKSYYASADREAVMKLLSGELQTAEFVRSYVKWQL